MPQPNLKFHISHFTSHTLYLKTSILHTSQIPCLTLHTSYPTPHLSHLTIYISYPTSHILYSHLTQSSHSPHFTPRISYLTPYISHFTLHISHPTPHMSHPAFHILHPTSHIWQYAQCSFSGIYFPLCSLSFLDLWIGV